MTRRRVEREPPRLVLVHGFDAKRFAERQGLEPFTHPCHVCGAPRETSLPFIRGATRGLEAPPCPCGNVSRMYSVPLEAFCK